MCKHDGFFALGVCLWAAGRDGAARLASAALVCQLLASVAHPDWHREWTVFNRLRRFTMSRNLQSDYALQPCCPILSFSFDHSVVRIVMRDGEPWFVASDLCAALGITNSRDALSKLDDDEKGVGSTDTLGGHQQVGVVSEPGMYTLVFRCRDAVKPGTVPYRFRRWVTRDVLPSIRKTGRYESAAQPSDPDRIDPRTLLLSEQSNLETELSPKVADAVDRRICATTKCG
ncbi:Bro-N domain-containing protein [Burkholderia arboris]|uniref:BRO-N domain-containing protein n=1 Tax=Burkholderia arboris TaxID=488730 RepID=UPI001CF3E7B3|nr:Bro-N domain-containing protein [Burkholderia arboris]MCA8037103.1 Bro-N domain-containing protein [Burkholderia arboris]